MISNLSVDALAEIFGNLDGWTMAFGVGMVSKSWRRIAMTVGRRVELRIYYMNILDDTDHRFATLQYRDSSSLDNKWNYVDKKNDRLEDIDVLGELCLKDSKRGFVLKDMNVIQLWQEMIKMPWFYRISTSIINFAQINPNRPPISPWRPLFIQQTMDIFYRKFRITLLGLGNVEIASPEEFEHFKTVVNLFNKKLLVHLSGRFPAHFENVLCLLLYRKHNVQTLHVREMNQEDYDKFMSFMKDHFHDILRDGLPWDFKIEAAGRYSRFRTLIPVAKAMAKADKIIGGRINVISPYFLSFAPDSIPFKSSICSKVSFLTSYAGRDVYAAPAQEFPVLRVYIQDTLRLSEDMEFELRVKAKARVWICWSTRYCGSDERFERVFFLNEGDDLVVKDRVKQECFNGRNEPHLAFTYVKYSPEIRPEWLTFPRRPESKLKNIFPPGKTPFDVRCSLLLGNHGIGQISNGFHKLRRPRS